MGLGRKISVDDFSIHTNKMTLDQLADSYGTLSFLIIRNDTLIYKKYAEGFSESSVMTSFSIAKSFTSALLGIAIKEGRIKSVQQPVCDFIPELANKGFQNVKIIHLLKHTSGIGNNSGSSSSQNYYGRDLREDVLELKVQKKPGEHYQYENSNTELLGLILERATGQSLSVLLEEKIWKPLGMEYDATWSIDNKKDNGIEKAFCGINARSIDFARFGRLYLKKGNWNGKQIIPEQWVKESTHRDTLDGGKWNYQYHWLLGPKEYGSFFAVGLYGQFIYIYPKKNVVIVRNAKTNIHKNTMWKYAMLQIIDQL